MPFLSPAFTPSRRFYQKAYSNPFPKPLFLVPSPIKSHSISPIHFLSAMSKLPTPHEASKVCCSKHKIAEVPRFQQGDKLNVAEVHKYLVRYGYLAAASQDAIEAAADKAVAVGEDLASSLKEFQKFWNLADDGVFGSETRGAMKLSRCGIPDKVNALDFRTSGPWDHKNLTYAVGDLSAQYPRGRSVYAEAAVRRALDTWENAGVGLTFTKVSAAEKHDFFVAWKPANDPDHSMVGGVLAHADFPPGFSIIPRKKGEPLPMHFDDEEHDWIDGADPRGFDIETVALHEIGHILGMYHSEVPTAVMAPTVAPGVMKTSLTADDVAGIKALYGN
ncbi:peptidoglycan binding protein [Zalerion maritima]|uniref:Peptidoglycan binding protein n=1 Tax=Zalerion maritima TaxID=339359 RepID=A0AAD5RLR3_9PEZI|nr:peptidoglycan binding protein [Zalerion maritima]